MRLIALLLFAFSFAPLKAAAQQEPITHVPFVVERTYWIRSGKELQFIALFEKNHAPLLRAKINEGQALWMRLSRPQFNATHEQWDLRVTVAWRDANSAIERISQANAQLSKDTQRLAMEQQIMEELILEHTDIPVQEWSIKDGGP